MNIITSSILIIFCLFQFYGELNSSLIINEIMPVPIDGEPEWIEIYNFSSNTKFSGLMLADAASIKKLPDFVIQKGSYAILTKDTALLKTFRKIPASAILLQITLPVLNNTFDNIIIKDSLGTIFDSVFYDMKWGEKGISLERKDKSIPAVSQDNWSASIQKDGATPGFMNSNSVINFDLGIESVYMNNDFKKIFIKIHENGTSKIDKFGIDCYLDTNQNGNNEINERVYSSDNLSIFENDTLLSIEYDALKEFVEKNGNYNLITILNSAQDERMLNDTNIFEFYIRKEEPIIRINEIMYDINTGNAEFIEIWNGGTDTLLMDKFLIWDAAGSLTKGNIKINSNNFRIPPKKYGVITWDSSFFSANPDLKGSPLVYFYKTSFNLNQSSDLIVIADINGKIFDSLTYFNTWHDKTVKETKNRSLEKIEESLESSSQSSWSSSADTKGSTPALKNSITNFSEKQGALSINPNPFNPSGIGKDSKTVIDYTLPYLRSMLNAGIYDINGYKISELANNRYSASFGSLVWDGRNSEGFIMPIGQYIILLEATDTDNGNVFQNKAVIVIGN